MNKIVLGKGLGALIPTGPSGGPATEKYRSIPLNQISANKEQPRRSFDNVSIAELAQSLREHGLIQPIVLTPHAEEDKFVIVAGERRFRAAQAAGFEEIPAVVLDRMSSAEMLELALVENLQREDLNSIEVAEGYKLLMERSNLSQQQVADKVGKSRPAVANTMRLLSLPEKIKGMLRTGQIREGHARTLLAYESEREMLDMAEKMISGNITVRTAERATPTKTRRKSRRPQVERKAPVIQDLESYLKRLLITGVRIQPSGRGGKIEIEYYSDDDLTRLIELLKKIERNEWGRAGS